MLKGRVGWGVFSFVFLFPSFSGFGWAQAAEKSSCVACHTEVLEEIKPSVHFRGGLSCHHCHGGNPLESDQRLAKLPSTGYVGIPNKKQMVETCGSCHANVEAMNFYGIRTDQLALYKTSAHGKKLFSEGNERVAGCSDCHGYHDVLSVTDPNSKVYPLNLPKTCDHCHGDKIRMAHSDLPLDFFKVYQESVHGVALLEKKNLSTAHCASCHGSHGAIPPGVKEIGATCGKCHINERRFFLESPHANVMTQGRFSECISCHDDHGVQRASKTLYDQTCIQCHAAGSSALEKGRELRDLLTASEGALRKAERLVREASRAGLFVEEEEAALEEARTYVIAMAPAQHTLSVSRLSELHKKLFETTHTITSAIHRQWRSLRRRKIALIPLWIFILGMVWALWKKYRRLKFWRQIRQKRGAR